LRSRRLAAVATATRAAARLLLRRRTLCGLSFLDVGLLRLLRLLELLGLACYGLVRLLRLLLDVDRLGLERLGLDAALRLAGRRLPGRLLRLRLRRQRLRRLLGGATDEGRVRDAVEHALDPHLDLLADELRRVADAD